MPNISLTFGAPIRPADADSQAAAKKSNFMFYREVNLFSQPDSQTNAQRPEEYNQGSII